MRAQKPTGHDGTPRGLPTLLTTADVAELLRTTRKAVWTLVERGQLPGLTGIGWIVLPDELTRG